MIGGTKSSMVALGWPTSRRTSDRNWTGFKSHRRPGSVGARRSSALTNNEATGLLRNKEKLQVVAAASSRADKWNVSVECRR